MNDDFDRLTGVIWDALCEAYQAAPTERDRTRINNTMLALEGVIADDIESS